MKRVPFDPAEMNLLGEWRGHRPGEPSMPILNTPITPRENMELFVKGEKPLWMPNAMETKMFMPTLLPDNLARGMVSDMPDWISKAGGFDMFGVEWSFIPEQKGSMVRPGNPKVPDITEWEKYVTFPDLDALDWAGSAEANKEYLDDRRAIRMTIYSGLFERLISFMDMGNALMALVDEDEQLGVHRLFDRLCELYDDLFARLAKWYHPTLLWFHDDWGSQRAPLFSLDVCREMIVPYLRRVVDSAHKYGIGFEFHSCGKNELLVPAMIEAGVDMWAGQIINDKDLIYREYGRDIKVGIDTGPILPGTTEQQLRENAQRLLDRFPENVYVGMDFANDPRHFPYIYEESRKRYS